MLGQLACACVLTDIGAVSDYVHIKHLAQWDPGLSEGLCNANDNGHTICLRFIEK